MNIEAKFSEVLEKKGFLVVTQDEYRSIRRQLDTLIKSADHIGATNVSFGLKQIKKELSDVVERGVPVGRTLMRAAADVHPDVEAFVLKLTNTRAGLIGPTEFKQIASIMSRKMAERAPITERFTKFWNVTAKTFMESTGKVDIPWVTFDGKIVWQRYRPKIQEAIEFRDPVTGRMVRNIYESSAPDALLLGKSSITKARIGMGVNGNHSSDASIVRMFHLASARDNIPSATIHDAFFTNIGDANWALRNLREIYAQAVEADIVRRTLKELRKQGLPVAKYDELIRLAKREGLLDPDNPLTARDILRPLRPGENYYGIGP